MMFVYMNMCEACKVEIQKCETSPNVLVSRGMVVQLSQIRPCEVRNNLSFHKSNYFPEVIHTISVKYIVPCEGAQVV